MKKTFERDRGISLPLRIQLHNSAMEWVDISDDWKKSGDHENARVALQTAAALDARAAELHHQGSAPHVKAVLCRSAASIYLQLKEYRKVRLFVELGLEQGPPEEIKRELLDVLKECPDLVEGDQ